MSEDLDSIVKGAPAPGRDVKAPLGTSPVSSMPAAKPGDALSHTPSSPSMIYLNLLVLEASLRAQFLELRARRRRHAFFLMVLIAWVCGFGYALFLSPREDGKLGGSIYWAVEAAEKVCFMGGVITAVLVWATGIFDRGIRWPRRWLAVSNRGLRGFNCKLVVVSRSWWAESLSTVGFYLTYGLFHETASSSYRRVDPSILRDVERELSVPSAGPGTSGNTSGSTTGSTTGNATDPHPLLPILIEDEERGVHEEDLAPGGDYVKLLLQPKPFSPAFRENWELYRAEYWERENERRALLRAKLDERDRRLVRQRSPWFWWLPWRHRRSHPAPSLSREEPTPERTAALPRHLTVEREQHKRRSSSHRRSSTSSSRSQTPTLPSDFAADEAATPPAMANVTRMASSASSVSDKRRKRVPSVSGRTPVKRSGPESRSVTPEIPSPLAKESLVGSGTHPGLGGSVDIGGARTIRHSSSKAGSLREKAR